MLYPNMVHYKFSLFQSRGNAVYNSKEIIVLQYQILLGYIFSAKMSTQLNNLFDKISY